MKRWESIAEQFDGVEGVSLKAVLRNDEVRDWKIYGHAVKQFLDVTDEARSLLDSDDRYAWFNHLWKTYQNRFVGQPFPGVEPPSDEEVWFCNSTVEDAGRLSARAAKDLADVESEQATRGEIETSKMSDGNC